MKDAKGHARADWWWSRAVLPVLVVSCANDADWLGKPGPANLRLVESRAPTGEQQALERKVSDWSRFPVPPADGPTLAPLAMQVTVRERPERESPLVGALRVGARVPRSAQPVSHRGCPDGWYALNPLGFVCTGPESTIRLDHPIARAIQVEPDRSRPMPYRYGFIRAIAPNYLRVPNREEQFRYEMRLERHLRNWKKLAEKWDALDVGANDVPLDERGFPRGTIPEHALPLGVNERYGGNGDDRVPWWLTGERRIPNLSSFRVPEYAVMSNRIKRHAGVSLIGTFISGEQAERRRFAITADARLIPADKIKASSGSPFHGQSITEHGLPAAYVADAETYAYQLNDGHLERGEKLSPRDFVLLNGEVRILRGRRMVQTRDGRWLRSAELRTVAKPTTLPSFARGQTRWIDVSIINQSMVLWEGERPVYVTLVSTGRDGLGEPGKTLSTPQGAFRIYQKHVTATMDSEVADKEFELRDVPWVMYFQGGYALHGAYWHDDFGRARSHGCVNLSPIDARVAFFWSTPDVPEHWHSVQAGGAFEEGTWINIHP